MKYAKKGQPSIADEKILAGYKIETKFCRNTESINRLLKEETIPNQLGKEVQNPTMRWIFQIMEGVGIICFFDESPQLHVGYRLLGKGIITPVREKA